MSKKSRSRSRYVPYARGFRAPSDNIKRLAVTAPGECTAKIGKEFTDGGHFKSLQRCQSVDDWLAQVKETGQTFTKFLNECPWLSTRRWRNVNMKFVPSGQTVCEKYPDGKVYIVPIGDFAANSTDGLHALKIDEIIEYCRIFLGLPVAQLPAINLVAEKGKMLWLDEKVNRKQEKQLKSTVMPSRYHKESNHYQLHVPKLLARLRSRLPDDAICLLGLTIYDLFEDETDLFVAGMAAGNHRVGVFSLSRYDPGLTFSKEHWHSVSRIGGIDEARREELVLQRGCKLVVHEVCHILGIDHCVFYMCCMNGSGHLEEDFRQPMFLCPIDLRKLQTLSGFDVIQRYELLRDYCVKHHMLNESSWLEKRLSFLKDI